MSGPPGRRSRPSGESGPAPMSFSDKPIVSYVLPPSAWLKQWLAELRKALAAGEIKTCGHPRPPYVVVAGQSTAVCTACTPVPVVIELARCPRCAGELDGDEQGLVLIRKASGLLLLAFVLCRRCLRREVGR